MTVTVDVWRLQQLLAAVRTHPHAEVAHCPICCTHLAEVATLYRGPLLAGELWTDSRPFEEWLLLKREQIQRQALDALHALAVHHEAVGAYDQAQHYAQRQLALEPWREAAHRQLMRVLALDGQRSAALAHYESCRLILREELDVEPDTATIALVEQIRQGELPDRMTRWQDDKMQHASARPVILSSPDPVIPSAPPKILTHVDPLPDQWLFGIARARAALLDRLCVEQAPWLLAIDGIGGIGKTTLATVLVHELADNPRFVEVAWVSARQSEFQPASGLQSLERPALDVATLTTLLLEQLMERPPLTASNQEQRILLTQLLKAQPCLVVIDNLETVVDGAALVPFLQQLANPSKFLITSRVSLQGESGVYCQSLHELSAEDVLAFLRHEAEVRGIQSLIDAREEQLRRIYAVVGGNPLALKLVLGQVRFLPLAQVLANLQEALGQPVHDLYTYIYWQAWHLLNDAGRRLLLVLPIESNSTYGQLTTLDVLAPEQLQQALAQLLVLSLVQVSGDLEQPRYTLHRLTKTFLLREVVQWLTPADASSTM
ncbi:MAG: BTAD domain-containing putative transcriptional regulator [Caldilineaceae bacterium]